MIGHSLGKARAGDWVIIDFDLSGEIVFCSEADSYADDFPKSDWPPDTYSGLMIRQENGALIFHPLECFSGDHPISIEWDATKVRSK